MKNFDNVKEGDILRHANGDSYLVMYVLHLKNRKIPVVARTISATNPSEWEKFNK